MFFSTCYCDPQAVCVNDWSFKTSMTSRVFPTCDDDDRLTDRRLFLLPFAVVPLNFLVGKYIEDKNLYLKNCGTDDLHTSLEKGRSRCLEARRKKSFSALKHHSGSSKKVTMNGSERQKIKSGLSAF